jgi:transposase
MAHELKMAIVQSIVQLHSIGWSQRRIARELGINRETVRRYVSCREEQANPAISPAGSDGSNPATFCDLPARAGEEKVFCGSADHALVSKPAISPAGSTARPHPSRAGRPSHCGPYCELILAKLGQGLSAQRIFQDLVSEHGFAGGYDSVKRFVRRLGHKQPLPMRRMECVPGYEAQVDFGKGAPIVTSDGKRRKTHVFRLVLSHSRKGYSEATFRQTTEDFINCLEHAFHHLHGAPRTLVIDNFKAAVIHPDWFDPELVPRLEAFCRYYGTVILPTRPRTPRHKGKTERGVGYVQDNGLKARQFSSLEAENQYLLDWETNVADKRIHGTTRKQVEKVFLEVEQPALLPLPLERFPFFQEAKRKVNRDGHVEVAKAYYSVPAEYLGRTVWARWDSRLVRIFTQGMKQISLHVRHEQGRFSTHAEHVPAEKISGLEHGAAYLLEKVKWIGPAAHQWAEAMLHARGIQGTRVLMGLVSLGRRHPCDTLEKACRIALSYGAFHLRTIRQLLKREAAEQETFAFLQEHPIIRPLDDYAQVVARALGRKTPAGRQDDEGFGRHGSGVREHHEKCPSGMDHQGCGASSTRPRSGYPSSGCSPAEPDSVSPDTSSIVRVSPFHQEPIHE